MGRIWICQCGYVKFWHSQTMSAENSQHISDWYSFSHIIHGMVFYGLFHLVGRGKWSLGLCLVLAICVEGIWEIIENTPLVINRYREGTASPMYYGDSILNSVCDMLYCAGGFFVARYLPVWATVLLIVLMEVGVAFMIRDNLTLNIIMLLFPIEAIKRWQMGG